MRKLLFLLFITIALSSCRKDFEFEPNTGGLSFSKDTVYLDTVFTNIGSSTYRLKVYNKSDKDISIPKVQLGKGINSKYRLMIDGMTGDAGAQGKIFSNVELLAKDSLFIFIEVTSDVASANPTDFLYTDQIQFTNVTGAPQTVELVTLIQDAIFIYPNRTLNNVGGYNYETVPYNFGTNQQPAYPRGKILSGPLLNWNTNKPYVIYGFAFVPDGETLNIEPGAKVYFHDGAGIMVAQNGTLNIGDPINNNIEDEVIFEGDRLEYSFDNVPGQWFGVINFSTNQNFINHLTIKNATIGIYNRPLDAINNPNTAKLKINNSKILNCSYAGIYSLASEIEGINCVINNCGQFCVGLVFGGKYNFTHCTFNNNWNSSKQVAVYLDDYLDETTTNPFITTFFKNCIIYGSNQKEIFKKFIDTSSNQNCTFNNNLIKHNSSNELALTGTNNFFTGNPNFKNVAKHQLNVLAGSAAINSTTPFIPQVSKDIINNPRSNPPTIGAYEYIP
jgi:hypothetical protein